MIEPRYSNTADIEKRKEQEIKLELAKRFELPTG